MQNHASQKGDTLMIRNSFVVGAILAIAVATSACRREAPVPEPMGLGATSVTSQAQQ
jgi:hypothetical protein